MTSVQLMDRSPDCKQTHLEDGCFKPFIPSKTQFLQACSRPGPGHPFISVTWAKGMSPASDNRNPHDRYTPAPPFTCSEESGRVFSGG